MFGKEPATGHNHFVNPIGSGTEFLRNTIRSNVYTGSVMLEERLVQYQLNWRFYNGRHWAGNNDTLIAFNYVRAVIDKVNNFIAGKEGFELNIGDEYGEEVPKEVEVSLESLLNYNWRKNNRISFIQKVLQMGSICGDAYIFLALNSKRKFIEYTLLDSRMVVPKFRNGDHTDIESYRIIQQLALNEKKFIQKVTEYTVGNMKTYYVKSTGDNAEQYEVENAVNDLYFIPIVHIQNIAMSEGFGGKSDVEDIIILNKTYNEMAEDLKMIINYHSQPTTVITGATVGQVKRGIDQIWSGLPADASVFNLNLESDMSSSLAFLKLLKDGIHDLTGVPEEVMSKVNHISNTSAAALQMLLQPLILVADKKIVTYGEGMEMVHRMTGMMYQQMLGDHPLFIKLPAEAKATVTAREWFDRFIAHVIFKYSLPNDRLAMLNEIVIELANGIGSRKEAMARLGKRNIPLLEAEIEADTEVKIATAKAMEPEPIKPPGTSGAAPPSDA